LFGFAPGKVVSFLILIICWIAIVIIPRLKLKISVRRLPGIDAIEDSIGRAAEMGRGVTMLVGGLGGYGTSGGLADGSSAPAILSGLAVAGYVARMCARLNIPFIMPIENETIIPSAMEITREAYIIENNIDNYNADSIVQFMPSSATVIALAERFKPATNIMLGPFWAPAVQYTEAYNRVGAFQIGGSSSTSALSYFATACDYLIIGEEVYAVGAYISQEPKMIATLTISDYMKVLAIILLIVGAVSTSLGNNFLTTLLRT